MKKVINIFVSIIFLISFIGVNVHKHYSHGKLYSTAIFHQAQSCCANMEQSQMTNLPRAWEHHQENDCSCEDKSEIFKITNAFVSEKLSFPTEIIIDLSFVPLFQTLETLTLFVNFSNRDFNIPLPFSKTDVQSEFGIFRI